MNSDIIVIAMVISPSSLNQIKSKLVVCVRLTNCALSLLSVCVERPPIRANV